MARSKKNNPSPFKTPPDPQRAARVRRFALNALLATVLLAGSCVAFLMARVYVDRTASAARQSPQVVLKNRPNWMTDFLAEQIARCAQPAGTYSVFDHDLLVNTRDMLKANPWIHEVRQVRRAYGAAPGDTLEIDCEYRAPVALVHWKDYYWLVDGDGVKLPEPFGPQHLGRIVFGQDKKVNIRVVEGVQQPPPESGSRWSGDDLRAALDLVKLLCDKPYAQQILRVDCSNYAGRLDAKAAQLVLITDRDTQVRWGRPIADAGEDFFVEVPPQKKLEFMQAIVDELKHVDGNCAWVDLRFDTITRPSEAQPQTANAPMGQ